MRRSFCKSLVDLAEKDSDVMLLTVDVGFGVLEPFKDKYSDRFINTGIGEANAVSFATGLAMKGKVPYVFSIGSFLAFRALEQIRMLQSMNQHVVLVGVGKDDEYTNFGITHYTFGDKEVLDAVKIRVDTPNSKEDVSRSVFEAYRFDGPTYIRLSRF